MFDRLGEDIIINIMTFLSNKDTCSFVGTCKKTKEICYDHGYLKSLHFGYDNTDKIFDMYKHKRTLYKLIFTGWIEPQKWIQHWPTNVSLYNCRLSSIDPKYPTITENLYIYNDNKNAIYINWSNFPRLRKLWLDVYDINTEDMHVLIHLEHARLKIRGIKN